MYSKLSLALLLIFGGWLAVFWEANAAGYETGRALSPLSQSTPVTPSTPQPTPTIDRLAAPPTVENPTQADEGAQLFWLHCQPCHGDVGQGLTDEWRAQYPPEDMNCWDSGCHGRRPYENGFTLPTAVPAVVGETSLTKYETMGQVYSFMVAAMPYQDPGHLSEEEYLAIAAFLARAHDVWDGTPLTAENAGNFRLRPGEATPTPTLTIEPGVPESQANNGEDNQSLPDATMSTFIIGLVLGIIGSLLIIFILLRRRMK